MSTTIVLPEGFSWVVAAFVSSTVLLLGQGMVVGQYRKKAGVDYPAPYADAATAKANPDALKFNCVQRAHQNTLENIGSVWITTLVTAMRYPKFAGGALGAWVVARVLYTRGYATGVPNKRYQGGLGSLVQMALLGTSIYTSWQYFLSEL